MSVLIKGMEMPHDCEVCPCLQYFPVGTFACGVTHTMIGIADKSKDCPLIEVPTPHGRLIDADALIELYEPIPEYAEYVNKWEHYVTPIGAIRQNIKDAPTVIEAEGK